MAEKHLTRVARVDVLEPERLTALDAKGRGEAPT